MKFKFTYIILIFIVACLLLCNIGLLYLHQKDKSKLENTIHNISKLENLKGIEFMFEESKAITKTSFKYEQYNIGDVYIYTGSDNNALQSVRNITNKPKLVMGLNKNMCSPCIEGVLFILQEFFPDYKTNPNIICIADIEQRFKDNYFNMKVISFHQKGDFPLYEIDKPYFFILDKDLYVKLLFITSNASPEMIKEYLKIIKLRYPEI